MTGHTTCRRKPLLFCVAVGVVLTLCVTAPSQVFRQRGPEPRLDWQTGARLHRPFLKSVAGKLLFSTLGVEFHADRAAPSRWRLTEIKTFKLTGRRLILTTYQNNGWHRPGDRQYRFDLFQSVPPDVASQFAELLGKPAINGDPGTQTSFASIPARHRTLTGGTNGVLHFTEDGIRYVTPHNQGARNWRWADIQTIASPDPHHFRVGGYRETFDFELKQPMSQALFDRLWDYVYTRDFEAPPNFSEQE